MSLEVSRSRVILSDSRTFAMEIWVFKPGTRRLGESRILPNAEKEKFADYALSVLRLLFLIACHLHVFIVQLFLATSPFYQKFRQYPANMENWLPENKELGTIA